MVKQYHIKNGVLTLSEEGDVEGDLFGISGRLEEIVGEPTVIQPQPYVGLAPICKVDKAHLNWGNFNDRFNGPGFNRRRLIRYQHDANTQIRVTPSQWLPVAKPDGKIEVHCRPTSRLLQNILGSPAPNRDQHSQIQLFNTKLPEGYFAEGVDYAVEFEMEFKEYKPDAWINIWQAYGKTTDGVNRQVVALYLYSSRFCCEDWSGEGGEFRRTRTPEDKRISMMLNVTYRFRFEFKFGENGYMLCWMLRGAVIWDLLLAKKGFVGSDLSIVDETVGVNRLGVYSPKDQRAWIHSYGIYYGQPVDVNSFEEFGVRF